jgi:hypothetical protein
VNGVENDRFTDAFTSPFTSSVNLTTAKRHGCAQNNEDFVRAQNTDLGWSDPVFTATEFVAVAPAQLEDYLG